MYYDNKQEFYIRQYGPAVIVCVVSLILISSGVFLYMKSSNIGNPFNKKNEVAQTVDTEAAKTSSVDNEATAKKDDSLVEQNALVNENKVEEAKTPAPVEKYFEGLATWEKSKNVNVTNVNASGTVNVEINGDKLEVTLIGVDFKYSKDAAVKQMKSDLLNKQVKIAFDTVRSENGVTYAYIFRDNSKTSYNAELLKTGLVTLKTERKNTKLNKELASAQAYARQNSLGVWNK